MLRRDSHFRQHHLAMSSARHRALARRCRQRVTYLPELGLWRVTDTDRMPGVAEPCS